MSEPKYRHEIKYTIRYVDYLAITSRIKHFMKLDRNAGVNNGYHIRSLYFETPENKALNEKVDGMDRREKFRIRFYNLNDQFIRLEKKMKKKGLCLKASCKITKEECLRIMQGDIAFMKEHEAPLMQELYFKMTTTFLRPKTIVDYIREAYVYAPGNVRVTFDRNIQSGLHVTDLFHTNLPGAQVVPSDWIVLEVKYDNFLPSIIQDMIQTNMSRPQAFSKYAAARIFG